MACRWYRPPLALCLVEVARRWWHGKQSVKGRATIGPPGPGLLCGGPVRGAPAVRGVTGSGTLRRGSAAVMLGWV